MGALGLSHDVRTRWDDALAESQRVLDETKTLLRRKGGQRMNRIYWPHTAECLDAFVRAEREHDITTFQRLAECDGACLCNGCSNPVKYTAILTDFDGIVLDQLRLCAACINAGRIPFYARSERTI